MTKYTPGGAGHLHAPLGDDPGYGGRGAMGQEGAGVPGKGSGALRSRPLRIRAFGFAPYGVAAWCIIK